MLNSQIAEFSGYILLAIYGMVTIENIEIIAYLLPNYKLLHKSWQNIHMHFLTIASYKALMIVYNYICSLLAI